MNSSDTRKIYDDSAGDWSRDEPLMLSDYTARPFLVEWCEPLAGKAVLDLGCGEGYVSRLVARRGASPVDGIDLSPEMVSRAEANEKSKPLGVHYRVGDVRDLSVVDTESYDIVLAVFLFSYIDNASMKKALGEVHRILKPGGKLVMSLPHPAFPFMGSGGKHFYFQTDGGYFSARDRTFEGKIARRDGIEVPVRCVHKTFQDIFSGLGEAGFNSMPDVEELGVTAEHLELDPDFFGPLEDCPLHLALRVVKEK